jgi:chromosome segregation ATPase
LTKIITGSVRMEALDQVVPDVEGCSESKGAFKSPVRTLARFFRKSQQKWKKKALTRRARIKDLQHKVRDIDASRTGWKSKVQQLESDKEELAERLRVAEAERARLQAKVEEYESKKA